MSVPEVASRYTDLADKIFQTAAQDPAADFAVQLAKVARALVQGHTGRQPADPSALASDDEAVRANAVRPLSFKSLVGKGHAEFSSARQQDALEYFQFLLQQINRCEHANGERLGLPSAPPTKAAFAFSFEERVQCLESGCVRYRCLEENVLQVRLWSALTLFYLNPSLSYT